MVADGARVVKPCRNRVKVGILLGHDAPLFAKT